MRSIALVALSFAGLGLAADATVNVGMPNSLRGEYIEARTADIYTGPCFANAEVGLTGNLAVLGWKIEKGSFEGVSLDGLSVMGVVRADTTLGDFMHPEPEGARAVVIVDQKASVEQRMALQAFAQKMSGGLLTNVVRVESSPIEFISADIHSRSAKMVAGELAKVETRALADTDKICHNEDVWYQPLTHVDHAMAAYTVEQSYQGQGLNTRWSYPGKRSAYVGTFQVQN